MGVGPTAYVTVWAGVTDVHIPHVGGLRRQPGIRGGVVGLSAAARRRLIRTLAEARAAPQWWVTLTYAEQYPTARESKLDFAKWARWIIRKARAHGVGVGIVWRLESQSRGAPHFHCLVYATDRLPWWKMLSGSGPDEHLARQFCEGRKWQAAAGQGPHDDWRAAVAVMSAAWCMATGDVRVATLNRSVDVERAPGADGVTRYISKYISKGAADGEEADSAGTWASAGRRWGIRGEKSALERTPLGVAVWAGVGRDGEREAALWKDLESPYGQECARRGAAQYWVLADGEAVLSELRSRGAVITPWVASVADPQTGQLGPPMDIAPQVEYPTPAHWEARREVVRPAPSAGRSRGSPRFAQSPTWFTDPCYEGGGDQEPRPPSGHLAL